MPIHHVRDIDLYAEIAGSGPRLLFLSGSGADLRTARGHAPFAEAFEVLTFDQRGLGRSGKPDGPYTMADYAEDALALLDVVGWETCHVVGVSFGGMVAQEVALRAPDRVRRLVLCCSSSGGAGGSSYPIHEYLDLSPEEAARRSLVVQDRRRDAAWQRAHPDAVTDAIEARELQRRAWAADPAGERGYRGQLAARWAHDTYERLPQLAMPVLIAGGTYDGQAPPENQRAIHALIPHADLEFFEGGHGFTREDPTAVPRIIEWLSRAD